MSEAPGFVRPPKSLLRVTGKALIDFDMIREGDRVLLGLSGGKDSLSLLHILEHFRRHAPIHFDYGVVTIDPLSETFSPAPLKPYLAALGVDYHYVEEPIVSMAESRLSNNSYCAFCARMKRGLMYKTCREQGYNVLAQAQHLDDLAESFLMSAFHGGQLKTMKGHYRIDAGDLRVIRPLIYVRERQLREFATAASLPVIEENCPACFAMPTQREHMKQLLAREEGDNPNLFKTLKTTMMPLIRQGLPT
ncbi:MAG TPA: tRNA 2-thiocytidine biosynthesis protein TtcA [Rhodobacteraceae bacterium]|nr:tRNA 2-thiocytidine biosynthesis protein TtcA [Paracoccaceae bacterium]